MFEILDSVCHNSFDNIRIETGERHMQHSLDDESFFDIPDSVSQIANTFSTQIANTFFTYSALFDILDTVCHNFFSTLGFFGQCVSQIVKQRVEFQCPHTGRRYPPHCTQATNSEIEYRYVCIYDGMFIHKQIYTQTNIYINKYTCVRLYVYI